MRLFENANFDFLGNKTPFLALSAVLLAAGVGALLVKGLSYGIDFKGGTMTTVRFQQKPDENQVRQALSSKITGEVSVQPVIGANELIIGTELREESELEKARQNMLDTLQATFPVTGGKPDFHAIGLERLVSGLQEPLQRANIALSSDDLRTLAQSIMDFRNTAPRSGLLKSFDDLSGVSGVTPQILNVIKQEFSLSTYVVRGFEMVGPKIGAELRRQALYATLLALAGMLVYIAFRFEWVYGVAAVVAVFHDVVITLGLFALTGKEFSLTVIAALLTLVGFSMNDTIVVFDRIRENLKLSRKDPYPEVVNASINQTLSRTVLTSGLTFLTVVALWLFGGPVLNGFSFALVVGIIVGTYSSIFIASPIVVYYDGLRKQSQSAAAPAAAKVSVKAAPPAQPKRALKAK